ncbi:hypothetical protein M407DRAFT_131303 [Tulasnella calospora MUT 4182]|uniref:Uncharacterized protein n=1 Tax=Tulasnella calospora MUT 4182 TaxID=1051891 RepID=A0A0C3LC97_9AGAM|nr:hypothetical protein M407DRAFT_131303 [Tulasnella calospora MUT 4182]
MELVTVVLIFLGLLFFAGISVIALAECPPILPQYRSHVALPVADVPMHHHPQIQETIRTTQSAITSLIVHAKTSHHLGPLIQMVHITISHARLLRIPPVRFPFCALAEGANTVIPATQAPFDPIIEPRLPARVQSGRRLSNDLVLATTLSGIYLPSSSAEIDTAAVAIASGSPPTPQEPEASLLLSAPSSLTSQPAVH